MSKPIKKSNSLLIFDLKKEFNYKYILYFNCKTFVKFIAKNKAKS